MAQRWFILLLFMVGACTSKDSTRQLKKQIDRLESEQKAISKTLVSYKDSLQQPLYQKDSAINKRYKALQLKRKEITMQVDSLQARLQAKVSAIDNAPPD
jgi:chaperonin cofactor prefoldin